MEPDVSRSIEGQSVNCEEVGAFIAGLQKENGEIPWSEGGKTDPWDHVESAMGLGIAGYFKEARRAYEWMAQTQLADGSWWTVYRDGAWEDRTRDSNFSSYIAVGVFHYYLLTRDVVFLKNMWPVLSAGIDYALNLQAPTGEIYWARNAEGVIDRMALLTGSSSVYMSIKCALAIASRLGKNRPDWRCALEKLGNAIRNLPNHFN
ncbi:MAG: phenyltransferase domain-containing protein, partial [Thermodesulfobacteriota bacterium]|nr:phenyltransferase domain-containing protein [Thermodesulfobacteriota bacterium]